MNYFTPTNLPRQALNSQIDSDPRYFFNYKLTRTFKLVFKEYFSACQNHKKNYISQDTIAKRIGCSRETVNHAVQYFKSMGHHG